MLEIKKIETLDEIGTLKKQYFSLTTAPLDGMWHFGFVPMSDHFGFYENDVLIGYCCINAEGYMMQFYLSSAAKTQDTAVFSLIAQQSSSVIGTVNGAFVSTAESDYLALCLDNSSSFTVNAIMYQQGIPKKTDTRVGSDTPLNMRLAAQGQLQHFVKFAASNIGAPEQWLMGYYTNLIQRQELWGYWNGKQLIAAGEFRRFDEEQTEYVDLGMIVATSERGKGIATQVLQTLMLKAAEQNLTPICSTESCNITAQKAIVRAGLTPLNRIVQFEFTRA